MKSSSPRIGQNLRLLRKFCGFSQKEVAAVLQIDRSTYSCYERGCTDPPLQKLVLLADCYGVTLDALLLGDPCDLLFSLPKPTSYIDAAPKERPAE
ncbi:helix-turn-helix domain-containing protein [Anaeromassilibacillus senegalensis]|uniref:helix-turn-helix domain-containing protein n=1 Tax=Anaeromassilibacillus senegalensis TaxID=1673717 RepID=UPI00093C9D8F|nr:helix-turn-helix transcriptional regulator [Anaeromassilibacillus senegalensis]